MVYVIPSLKLQTKELSTRQCLMTSDLLSSTFDILHLKPMLVAKFVDCYLKWLVLAQPVPHKAIHTRLAFSRSMSLKVNGNMKVRNSDMSRAVTFSGYTKCLDLDVTSMSRLSVSVYGDVIVA
jgi:hypothetical protein